MNSVSAYESSPPESSTVLQARPNEPHPASAYDVPPVPTRPAPKTVTDRRTRDQDAGDPRNPGHGRRAGIVPSAVVAGPGVFAAGRVNVALGERSEISCESPDCRRYTQRRVRRHTRPLRG